MKAQPRSYFNTGKAWISDQKEKETSWPVTLDEVEKRAEKVVWYPSSHEFKGFLGDTLKTIIESYGSLKPTQIGVIEAANGADGFPLEIYAFDLLYKSGDIRRAIVYFADSAGHIIPMFSDTFTD